MNGRACSLVRASVVRVCTVSIRGLGMAVCFLYGVVRLRTAPRGGIYGQNLYWSLCATFSRVYMRYGVCACCTMFGLDSPSSVSCTYICVCTAVDMCSPSVVPLVVSTCMRACKVYGMNSLGGVRSIHEFLCLYVRTRCPNECGRVFPAGVGPGSPSRDAANWLPSRFSLSVETRRRYGWLRMMVFPGARLFPSPNLVPFGRVAARERQGALSRRAW